MPNCYYYDEQRNHCKCYVNENLNELLAENAKLREEIEAAKHDLQVFSMGSVQLDADNAKLRELVRAAWKCIHVGANCSDCRLIAGGCTLQTAMRELGIEVDE